MAEPRITMPALARIPLPAPGEHAAGYLRRLADENGLLLGDFRTLFGIRRISPRSQPEAWARLADGLGLPVSTFAPLVWRSVSPQATRWLSFLGHEIHDSFLHLTSTQLCRLCLTTSPIIRSAWSLRHLTACQIHKVQLSDACSHCGKPISLTRSYFAWTCSRCGADFRQGPTILAAADELTIADLLEARLSGAASAEPLPARHPLEPTTSSLHEMLASLAYLGSLNQIAAADSVPRRVRSRHAPLLLSATATPDQIRRDNRLALELLQEWPAQYHALLDSLVDKQPAPPKASPLLQRFATTAGIFAVRPLRDRVGEALPAITSIRLEYLQARVGYRPRTRIPRKSSAAVAPGSKPGTNMMSQEAVRRELFGRSTVSLMPWIKAGVLTPNQMNNGGIGFSSDEVRTLTAFAENLPPPPENDPGLLPLFPSLSRLAQRPGASADFLRSILTRKTAAYSSGPGLSNITVPGEALRHAHAVAALRHMISDGRYTDLSKIKAFTKELWGPLAFLRELEATQLIAARKLRFRRASYARRGAPRLYNVGDIVRDIQSWLGPYLLDVDTLEPRLPAHD